MQDIFQFIGLCFGTGFLVVMVAVVIGIALGIIFRVANFIAGDNW